MKLSAADTTAFLVAISILGLEYLQEGSTPWLQEVALCAVVASQCFSKMSDYFSVNNHRRRKEYDLDTKAVHEILKEELFIKLACTTLDINSSRGWSESLQHSWKAKRAMFISSLQRRDTEMVDIDLSDDERSHLLP